MNELNYFLQWILTFDTAAASAIKYQLQILRGSTSTTQPTGGTWRATPGQLQGTGSPVRIEGLKDDEVYRPIVGSFMDINLWQTEAGQYPDFTAGNEFEYQVCLKRNTGPPTPEVLSDPIRHTNTAILINHIGDGGTNSNYLIAGGNRTGASGLTVVWSGAGSQTNGRLSVAETITTFGFTDGVAGIYNPNGIDDRIFRIGDSDYRIVGYGNRTDFAAGQCLVEFARISGSDTIDVADNIRVVTPATTGNFNDELWRGFISPINTNVSESSLPFTLSFTAVDGLGLLEERRVEIPEEIDTDRNLFSYVLEALFQTGIGYDVYVDSGLRDAANDALLTATTHNYSVFTNRDRTEVVTYKEQLEGILSAFNCKIKQANGRWYIYNPSLLNNSVSWHRFEYNAETNPDTFIDRGLIPTAENLLTTITGSSSDLIPIGEQSSYEDLRPVGSVECRPQDQVPRNLIDNEDFSATLVNGVAPNFRHGGLTGISYSTTANTFLRGGRSISTDTNRRGVNEVDNEDIWFSTDPQLITTTGDIEFSFDWGHIRPTTVGDRAQMRYLIVAEFTSTPITEVVLPEQYTSYQEQYGYNADGTRFSYTRNNSQTRIFWNKEDNRWQVNPNNLAIRTDEVFTQLSATGGFTTVRETFRNPATFRDLTGGGYEFSDFRITIRFYAPSLLNDAGDVVSTRGQLNTYIDRVIVRNLLSEQFMEPVFERVQRNYTRTLEYEPRYSSGIPQAVYQRVVGGSGNTTFARRVGLTTRTEALTLEQIGTQLKLNDNANRLRRYDYTFWNNRTTPPSPIGNIQLNYAGFANPGVGTIDGYVWEVKQNRFSPRFHIHTQGTDVAPMNRIRPSSGTLLPGFYQENVELIPQTFPGRTNNITYTLSFTTVGLDDSGTPIQTPDRMGREPGDMGYMATTNALLPEEPYLQITDAPGTVHRYKLVLFGNNVTTVYQLSASNLSVRNTMANPAPSNVTILAAYQSGENVIYDLEITLPERPAYEDLYISGEVDPVTENTVTFNVSVSSTDTTGNIALTTVPVRGESGSIRTIQIPITPNTGRQLVSSNFAFTLSGGLLNAGVVQLGSGLLWSISVAIPEMAPTTNPSAVATNIDDIAASNVQMSSLTLRFRESVGNLSIPTTDLPINGAVGQEFTYFLRVSPAPGFELDSDNDDTIDNSPNAVIGNATQDGYGYLVPITGTIPATAATATITVRYTGTVQRIGADVVAVTVNYITTALMNATIDEPASQTFTNGRNTMGEQTLLIFPSNGRRFNAVSDVTITPAGNVATISSNLLADGTIAYKYMITFPDSNTASATGNSLTFLGNTIDEPFLLSVNITETLPLGKLSMNSYSQRFGLTDITAGSVAISDIVVSPTEDRMTYSAATRFNTSGASASNYRFTAATGVVTFNLSIPLLMSDFGTDVNGNTIYGDISKTISINGVGVGATQTTPGSMVANRGEFVLQEIVIPRGGGLPSVGFTANGRVSFAVSTMATSVTGTVGWLGSFVASYSNLQLTAGRVGHSGAVLTNNTGVERDAWLLMTPAGVNTPILDAVNIRQLAFNMVESPQSLRIQTSSSAPDSTTPSSTITIRTP